MLRKIAMGLIGIAALAGAVAWWLSAPAHVDPASIHDPGHAPGAVIAVEPVGAHNRLVLTAMVWSAQLPAPIAVSDGAAMLRVRYWSQCDGRPVEASGLIALPYAALAGKAPRGTAMFLHGTSPDRANSPSAPDLLNGVLPSAIFAGGGYILLAPDYIGLGTSHAPQTYIHTQSTVAAARDLLVAAQHVTDAMHVPFASDLYLVGFSQGGHATAVVQRSLEQAPLPGVTVRAAAAISGPFDLAGISVPYAFEHRHSLYLAYLVTSYAGLYHQPLSSLIVPRYAAILPGLFDGNHDPDRIAAALPADPRDLFLPDRLKEIEARQANWFTAALEDNEAWRWQPGAPLRLYFGDRDTDVSPRDSRTFRAMAARHGGNVQLFGIAGQDHGGSVMHAVPHVRAWFDTLQRAEPVNTGLQ